MDSAIVSAVIGGVFTLFGVWLNHRLTSGREQPRFQPQPSAASEPTAIPVSPTTLLAPTLRIGAVIRDVGIIQVLAAVGGYVIGAASGAETLEELVSQLLLAALVMNSVGFFISGWLADGRTRWKHLAAVAVGVWLTNTIITALMGLVSPEGWILNAVLVTIAMGIGGFLANQIKRA